MDLGVVFLIPALLLGLGLPALRERLPGWAWVLGWVVTALLAGLGILSGSRSGGLGANARRRGQGLRDAQGKASVRPLALAK